MLQSSRMAVLRRARNSASCWLVFSVLLLAGCSTLQPSNDRPIESASLPGEGAQWAGLYEGAEDRLVPLNLGPEALQWRLRALRSATTSIDLQTFIWKDDSVGLALVREIILAAERGVRVRILLDDSFLIHADEGLKALSSHPNIEYRIYNPGTRRLDSPMMREMANINDFARINHRMHNKLLVVDGRVAIIGGRNQAEEYFGYHPRHNFRDFELLLAGPFLSQLEDVFDLYWNDPWSFAIEDLVVEPIELNYASARALVEERAPISLRHAESTHQDWVGLFRSGYSAQLNLVVDTPPDVKHNLELPVQLAQALIDRIDQVESDLILVSAYFIPPPALIAAVERAAVRGVRVRVITNSLGSNNHVSAHAAYAAHRPALLAVGAELYELRADAASRSLYVKENAGQAYLGLHEKGAIFDDCCLFVGSANMDPRSLRLNTEVGLLIESPALNERVRQLLAIDMQPDNAWQVVVNDKGEIEWIGENGTRQHSPPASFFMRMESWFFGLLPLEDQM